MQENALNITRHQENTNQNPYEVSPCCKATLLTGGGIVLGLPNWDLSSGPKEPITNIGVQEESRYFFIVKWRIRSYELLLHAWDPSNVTILYWNCG